jgi:ubiquinol-cytochrome c reductase iron-sulfur subunit
MTMHEIDPNRRLLIAATAGVGGAGIAAISIPFIESMMPSEAAKAAGAQVEVDISSIVPGTLVTTAWRGKPVWILHRTDAMLASLGNHDQMLADPSSNEPQQPPFAKNPGRAIKQAYFVAVGICTHLGCVPAFRPEPGDAELGTSWPGGFYCPCHGSRFDLSGRVFMNVPAPKNLEVPEYQYLSATRLKIGGNS